uniref:Putative LOC592357 [Strongylocentrotus purpuratus] n=3 Tax=Lepeophtheirus salmonis TaxID=72036 RepID=A0A0K2V0J4_LEPSM
MEDRVEALTNAQSTKWMEFSKMADSMKELSHSMLIQSTNNTRKIRSNPGIQNNTREPS